MEKLRPFYVIPSLAGTVGKMGWHPPEADATYISLAASLNALARQIASIETPRISDMGYHDLL